MLNDLYEKYELHKSDTFKSPQGWTIITRSGIDKIQAVANIDIEYETLPGWTEDISSIREFKDLPTNCQNYLLRVEELVGVPVRWIGVGPGREALIDRGVAYSTRSVG